MNGGFLTHGKCIDNDKWVEGYFIEQDNPEYHAYICMSGLRAEVDNRHQDILECDLEEIIPKTAGRCVGLIDKNSKLMFEGDIVSIPTEEDLFKIEWDEDFETARFVVISYYGDVIDFDNYRGRGLEIVGNIYDNPELIGVDRNA